MKDTVVQTSPEFYPLAASVSRRYIPYVVLMGAVYGTLQFGDVIARKSLDASGLSITVLMMLSTVASVSSIWWGRILVGRDQRKLLLVMGSIGFLSLISVAALRTIAHLIAIHLIYYLAFATFGPAENRILQQHIPSRATGRTFGLANGLRMGLAAAVSAAVGLWLDRTEGGFRQAYPAAAVVGFMALILITSIPTGGGRGEPVPIGRELLTRPLQEVFRLLKERRDFLRFELAFMIYGVAYMMLLPVVPIYLVDDLKLSYADIGLARGTLPQLIMIGALPLFGRLFDRTTPHRIGAVIFLSLSLYPALLLAAGQLTGSGRMAMVYAAFGLFGVAMSGLTVIWHLSSIRFAGGDDAGVFQSVHVAMTGVRGMFAPLLGYIIMSLFSVRVAMMCSGALWVVAALAMVAVRRLDMKTGAYRPLRAA